MLGTAAYDAQYRNEHAAAEDGEEGVEAGESIFNASLVRHSPSMVCL